MVVPQLANRNFATVATSDHAAIRLLWAVADHLADECRASPDGGHAACAACAAACLLPVTTFSTASRLRREAAPHGAARRCCSSGGERPSPPSCRSRAVKLRAA